MNLGLVLDGIVGFEEALELYYASVRDESDSKGVRLLVYFLGRNRRRIQSIIEECPAEVMEEIRAIEVADMKASGLINELESKKQDPKSITAAELIGFSDGMDSLCLSYYKEVIQQIEDDDAIGVFDRFIDFKQSERTMLQKMSAVDY